ncbi:MAG: molybdopterin cofactor-binding domain-containing protein, partial [Candidatus Dormibacteraceae bacterium]
CHLESSGRGPYEGAAVEVHEDGSVSVAVGVTSQGQGHETAFAQVVAGELGVAEEVVRVSGGDTRTFHHGLGTFGSRSAVMGGNAVRQAARSVAAQLTTLAAERLAVPAADLRLVGGTVRSLDGRSIPIGDLATLASPVPFHGGPSFSRRARHARATSDPGSVGRLTGGRSPYVGASAFFEASESVWGYAMHAATVAVDPDSCHIEVLRYLIVYDCGRVLDAAIVEEQLLGGFAQGTGDALYQAFSYDPEGRLRNRGFGDLLVPYASDVVRPELIRLESPTARNPLGVKGVGEAAIIGVPAAVASAVGDALGIQADVSPLTPVALYRLLSAR